MSRYCNQIIHTVPLNLLVVLGQVCTSSTSGTHLHEIRVKTTPLFVWVLKRWRTVCNTVSDLTRLGFKL